MPDKDDWMRSLEIDLAAIEAQIEEISRAVGKQPPGPATASPEAAPPAGETATPGGPTAKPASLLDELRDAARERSQKVVDDDRERREREARLDRQMRDFFRYLTEFCRHLDTIKLPVPATYRLNPQTPIDQLHWQDSFVDSRSASLSETAPLALIQLRYTLAADGLIVIGRDIAHSGVFQNELSAMDMSYTVRDQRNPVGKLVAQEFLIERQVRVTIAITPDYESDTLSIRTRNFVGFGTVDFSCGAERLGKEFFDEFGKQIIGRPSTLMQQLKADIRLRP